MDNNDPEQQPLNGSKPEDKSDDGKPKPGEYQEKRKACFCFPLKCEIIFGGFLLLAIFTFNYLLEGL